MDDDGKLNCVLAAIVNGLDGAIHPVERHLLMTKVAHNLATVMVMNEIMFAVRQSRHRVSCYDPALTSLRDLDRESQVHMRIQRTSPRVRVLRRLGRCRLGNGRTARRVARHQETRIKISFAPFTPIALQAWSRKSPVCDRNAGGISAAQISAG